MSTPSLVAPTFHYGSSKPYQPSLWVLLTRTYDSASEVALSAMVEKLLLYIMQHYPTLVQYKLCKFFSSQDSVAIYDQEIELAKSSKQCLVLS
jgi:hypothetical protein